MKLLWQKSKQIKEERKIKELEAKNIKIDNSTHNTTININLNNFRDNSKNIQKILAQLNLDDFRCIVDNDVGIPGTIENIFKQMYNNNKFPENKTITMPDISKDEFDIYLDNMWKKVQYDKIRRPIINQLLLTDHVMMNFCTPEDASDIDSERALCLTHQEHYEKCEDFIKNKKNDKQIKQSLQDALF
mgnify:CR=1 FL=1